MKLNNIRLIKIVFDVLKRHDKQDLRLAKEIVEALAVAIFFEVLK